MVGIAVISGMVASLIGVMPLATDPPPTGPVAIDIITVNGFDCPIGSVTATMKPDNTAFTLSYAAFGPAPIPPVGAHRGCELNLVLHAPSGYTYAIQQAEYDGFALLGPGATGRQRAGLGFVTAPPAPLPITTHLVRGPFTDNWQATDQPVAGSLIFAPCGRPTPLAITSTIDVSPTNGNLMTLDSATYGVAWRRCFGT